MSFFVNSGSTERVPVATIDKDIVWYDPEEDGKEIIFAKKPSVSVVPPSIRDPKREREVFFVSGRSGSGKSYFSAGLLNWYRSAGWNIYVFTEIPDEKFGDDAIYLNIKDFVGKSVSFEREKTLYETAKLNFKYAKRDIDDVEMLKELEKHLLSLKPAHKSGQLELKVSPEKMKKIFTRSVVLMDDYKRASDGSKQMLEFFRNKLLDEGRHLECSMIVCDHATNGKEVVKIIDESTHMVLFKKNTPRSRLYFMQAHLGMSNAQARAIDRRFSKGDRWVCIDRDFDIVITPTSVGTLKSYDA